MSKKKKKLNPLNKLTSAPKAVTAFIKEAREELKKVAWPNRQTTLRYTFIVIAVSAAVSLVIGGIDFIFSRALEQLI